jgi:hypothetical protein
MSLLERPIGRPTSTPLIAGDMLAPKHFDRIRNRLVLDGCKWDPQVGDVSTIARFPLLLSNSHWRELADLATRLTAELIAAEQELLDRPDLHHRLALPRRIRSVLRRAARFSATPAAARVMRFDFHWTRDGWRISEVNSDVPGGYCESSLLPAVMAEHYPNARPAGNPGAVWADAIAASVPAGLHVALLAAPGFIEDQQVIAYIARQLGQLGMPSHWAAPEHLQWRNGIAHLDSPSHQGPLGAIVRFFQAEWLSAGASSCLFVGGQTPVANPGIAILTESKRFPLVWDDLATPLHAWRQLLPETRDPGSVDWVDDPAWLVKSALCNTGDTVAIRALLTDRQWKLAAREVRWHPGHWIAQRRFDVQPVESPAGNIYPCIGVYTINGSPAGIYGRFSRNELIDFAAVDVAVLIADDEASHT